jgi:hypothetical protein
MVMIIIILMHVVIILKAGYLPVLASELLRRLPTSLSQPLICNVIGVKEQLFR